MDESIFAIVIKRFLEQTSFTAITQEGSSSSEEDITVLVGPEGDFSIDEVRFALEHGFESVTLGNSRLRTETAGLSAVMMSQLARRV